MTFTEWWAQNRSVYEKAGISEDIAKSIWGAACDNLEIAMIKELSRFGSGPYKHVQSTGAR